jgi:hypothetical protein
LDLFAGKGEDLLDLFVVGLHGGRGKWVLWGGNCWGLSLFAKFLNGSFEKLPAGEGEKEFFVVGVAGLARQRWLMLEQLQIFDA